MNIAVFASGNGSNFAAIAEAVKTGKIKASLKALIVDKPKAYVITRAKEYNIPCYVIELKNFNSKKEYEEKIVSILKPLNIDLICLAGYMKICDEVLLNNYPNKIINIHPALLPAFKGAHAILDAYNYGVKITGVTIHYVNKEIDGGKIIAQEAITINDDENIETLEARIHEVEHKLYVKTINKLLEDYNARIIKC